MKISKENIKESLTSIIAFIIVNIIILPFYTVAAIFFPMTGASGDQLSMLYLPDILLVLKFSVIMILVASIPHIISLVIIMIINFFKKGFFKIKSYICFLFPICFVLPLYVIIITMIIAVHGDFSKEKLKSRLLDNKVEQGEITERSDIYSFAHKYLGLNTIDEMKKEIKLDKFMLFDEYGYSISFLGDVLFLEKEKIYKQLGIRDNYYYVIDDKRVKENLREIINDIEKSDVTVEEVHEKMNTVLGLNLKTTESSDKENNISMGRLKSIIAFELTNIVIKTENIENKYSEEEQIVILHDTIAKKINRIETFAKGKDYVTSEKIYIDYLDMLKNNSGNLSEFKVASNEFSKKYNIDTNSEMMREFISYLKPFNN